MADVIAIFCFVRLMLLPFVIKWLMLLPVADVIAWLMLYPPMGEWQMLLPWWLDGMATGSI